MSFYTTKAGDDYEILPEGMYVFVPYALDHTVSTYDPSKPEPQAQIDFMALDPFSGDEVGTIRQWFTKVPVLGARAKIGKLFKALSLWDGNSDTPVMFSSQEDFDNKILWQPIMGSIAHYEKQNGSTGAKMDSFVVCNNPAQVGFAQAYIQKQGNGAGATGATNYMEDEG